MFFYQLEIPFMQIRNLTRFFLFLFLVAFSLETYSQVNIQSDLTVQSRSLQGSVPFTVILPSDYDSTEQEYPVIYLLHGYGGDHSSWINRCKINNLIDSLLTLNLISDYIYVLPDAGNSYYLNNFDSSYNYTDFFIEELVPLIDARYRTKARKEYRTLMGLSMGGFGSIILALKAPELFSHVIAMSAAVRNEAIFKSLPQSKYENYFGKVYGFGLAGEERITSHWIQNSPYFLIDTGTVAYYKEIQWYIDCGIDDFLFPANEAFHDLLVQYKLQHEYHVRPGRHNWEFWYSSTVNGLLYLEHYYNSTGADKVSTGIGN